MSMSVRRTDTVPYIRKQRETLTQSEPSRVCRCGLVANWWLCLSPRHIQTFASGYQTIGPQRQAHEGFAFTTQHNAMGTYSKLHDETYNAIRAVCPEFHIQENIRPEWLVSSKLTKLELDLYIKEINTAIEIQGAQHYVYIPHFHKTYADFKDQQRRDQEKRDLCRGNGVYLVEIANRIDLKSPPCARSRNYSASWSG